MADRMLCVFVAFVLQGCLAGRSMVRDNWIMQTPMPLVSCEQFAYGMDSDCVSRCTSSCPVNAALDIAQWRTCLLGLGRKCNIKVPLAILSRPSTGNVLWRGNVSLGLPFSVRDKTVPVKTPMGFRWIPENNDTQSCANIKVRMLVGDVYYSLVSGAGWDDAQLQGPGTDGTVSISRVFRDKWLQVDPTFARSDETPVTGMVLEFPQDRPECWPRRYRVTSDNLVAHYPPEGVTKQWRENRLVVALTRVTNHVWAGAESTGLLRPDEMAEFYIGDTPDDLDRE